MAPLREIRCIRLNLHLIYGILSTMSLTWGSSLFDSTRYLLNEIYGSELGQKLVEFEEIWSGIKIPSGEIVKTCLWVVASGRVDSSM